MTRLAAIGVALVFCLAAASGPALAGKRVALVIGNSDYEFAPNLRNPRNDAGDIADLLEQIGFNVTLALDLPGAQMRASLHAFAGAARGADIATVFYAGHGIEIERQNYLIPVDARLTTDQDVHFEAIALGDVLRAVEAASGLQIVILDACRENPFAAAMERTVASRSIGRGLARIEPEGSSVLVAYSAREGQVAADGRGRNSPYTTALLDHLATPGLEVGLLFRKVRQAVMAATDRAQQPFVYQSLGDEVYLVALEGAGDGIAFGGGEPASPGVRSDAAEAWDTTKDTTSIAVLEAFIARFEGTLYADLAAARLQELRPSEDGGETLASTNPPDRPTAPPRGDTLAALGDSELRVGNYAEALRFAREAASLDSAHGISLLGVLYDKGLGIEQDYGEALRLYRRAADLGRSNAMMNVGLMYQDGRGVARDDIEAAAWYRRAADAGNPTAMNNLGSMYREGRGVAQSDTDAVRLYRQSADIGNPLGMNNLAVMYEEGRGVARSDAEAVRLYRRAAELGEVSAMGNLGRMYDLGHGVERDPGTAARYIMRAITNGSDLWRDKMIDGATSLSAGFRRAFQQLLADAGVYHGAIGDTFGPDTIQAIGAL